jgi:hypothetical protein
MSDAPPVPQKQLPNRPYVTACEAVCWLALDDALTSTDIVAPAESDHPDCRKPKRELTEAEWEDVRTMGRKLLEASAASRLTLIGRPVKRDGLGDPEKISPHFLTAAVILDPTSNSVIPDAMVEFAKFERNVINLTRWEEVVLPTEEVHAFASRSANGLTKRQRQIIAIADAAKQLFPDPLSIPEGGKSQIKEKCERNHGLFAENSFKKAWQAAVNEGRIRMSNHDQFARR